MKQVYFAYCNKVTDCEEVLKNVERFFVGKGWNLLISEKALSGSVDHSLDVNFSIIDKSALVIVEMTSKNKEVEMVHEHAVNKGLPILHIRRKGAEVLESLKKYEKSSFEYEKPSEIFEWLRENVEV